MAVTATITAAVISADRQAHEAHRQRGLQNRSRITQENAQREATRIQLIERQRAELAASQAARPSASAALNENPIDAATTDLTGGIERDRLRLMRTSRLGG